MLFIVETYFSPEMKTFLNVLETLSFTVSSRMIKNQCHVVATLGLLLGSRQCFLSLRLVSTHGQCAYGFLSDSALPFILFAFHCLYNRFLTGNTIELT